MIKNRTLLITLAILATLFLLAIQGLSTKDWVITVLRGLSVGMVTFLVAAGLSLIFGLMDVLNLAHGTLFMLGAYVGWTVYVRPDTFVDLITPLSLLTAGLVWLPVWDYLLLRLTPRLATTNTWLRFWPWLGLAIAGLIALIIIPQLPIASWSLTEYSHSPIAYSLMRDQGQMRLPEPSQADTFSPLIGWSGLLLSSILAAFSLAGLAGQRMRHPQPMPIVNLPWPALVTGGGLMIVGLGSYLANDFLTAQLLQLSTTWLFLIALVAGTVTSAILGSLMEIFLIRPLYDRPIYQLMLTLGLAVIGHEVVINVWGRPEFTMPKPALFNGTGEGCPAETLADWLSHSCATVSLLGGRVRTYNEILVILVGLIVLIAVTLLMQRSRLGMIIRAGVQDSEMVEALGINVRRVFTLVFALGAGLAGLGGVIASPAMGLSPVMGENLLIMALIALAIGGLTSFPGAAAGSILVGLLEQFIIKYGQIGISLPFLSEPFKPSPTLVPASTVLLMVIILLLMPQGLFGRRG